MSNWPHYCYPYLPFLSFERPRLQEAAQTRDQGNKLPAMLGARGGANFPHNQLRYRDSHKLSQSDAHSLKIEEES